MKEQAARIGARFAPPIVKTIPSDNKSYFVDAISKGVNEIHQSGYQCEMVFCLLPNRKADTYAAIKKVCFLDNSYKIPSQVKSHFEYIASSRTSCIGTKIVKKIVLKLEKSSKIAVTNTELFNWKN